MLTELIIESSPNAAARSPLRLLQRLYNSRNGTGVWEFIESHPFLIPVLEEVHQRASDYFSSSPKLVLEVTTDPEAADSHALFVFIQTNLSLVEALGQLERFDEDWWLEASERARGLLCIDVECA